MKILVLQLPLAFTLAYYILLYGHILVLQTGQTGKIILKIMFIFCD